jgi:hypothetical protein
MLKAMSKALNALNGMLVSPGAPSFIITTIDDTLARACW